MTILLQIDTTNAWQWLVSDQTLVGHLFRSWIVIMLLTVLVCFVVGELTRNFSQVDKLWSLMPIVYSWLTVSAFPASPRIWLMAILVTIWGLRLSYNFYRKGGYHIIPWKGEEDYRWIRVRQKLKKPFLHNTVQPVVHLVLSKLPDIALFYTTSDGSAAQ